MELDFTRLNEISQRPPSNGVQGEDASVPETAYKGSEMGSETTRESLELQRKKTRYNDMLEVYKEYQVNKKLSNQLQTDIRRGIQEGESTDELFLKAIKVIGLMTGESHYYDITRKQLQENR